MKQKKQFNLRINRRQFLQGATIGLAGGLLQACAGGQNQEVVGIPTAAPRSASDEPITLTMWYSSANHTAEYELRRAEIETKFNVRLNLEVYDEQTLQQKLGTALMAGVGLPDMFEEYHVHFNRFVKGSDAEIPFVSLTDTFAKSPYAGTVVESRLAIYTRNGQLYALPRDVHPELLLYHDAGWKEYGIDMNTVESWDDFLAACETVGAEATMPDGRRRYCIMDLVSGGTLPALLAQNGVWWVDSAGQSMLTSPEFKATVESWLRFKDYWVDIDWGNQVSMFKEGQYLAQVAPDWLFGIHKQGTADDAEWLKNSPIRLKTVPGGPTTGSWGGTGAGVLKRSPNAALAVEVLFHLYLENGEGQLNTRFAETGVLPPVTSAWDGPSFHVPEPYVGGQVVGELYAEAAPHIASHVEDWRSEFVADAWLQQATLLWADEITLDEAIKAAEADAQNRIEKNS